MPIHASSFDQEACPDCGSNDVYAKKQSNKQSSSSTPEDIATLTQWQVKSGNVQLWGITIDSSGNIYYSSGASSISSPNSNLNTIGRLNPITGEHTQWLRTSDNDARIRQLAIDSEDNVYFTDSGLDQIVKLDPATNTFTSWQLSNGVEPFYIAVDSSDKIYFTELEGNKIGRLDPSTNIVVEWALPTLSFRPTYIGIDSSGLVYVLEENGNTAQGMVVRLDPSTNVITEWSSISDTYVHGLAFDSSNNVYFAPNGKINKLNPSSNMITEWTLSDERGGSLAIDSNGVVYKGVPTISGFVSSTNTEESWSVPSCDTYCSINGIAVDSSDSVYFAVSDGRIGRLTTPIVSDGNSSPSTHFSKATSSVLPPNAVSSKILPETISTNPVNAIVNPTSSSLTGTSLTLTPTSISPTVSVFSPELTTPNDEEVIIASTEDGFIFVIATPIGMNSQQNLTFELSFEDADDNPIEHVNFDVSATQNGFEVLSESGQHTHGGTVEFTTATLNSDNPIDIQVRILGIGLPDDNQNWTMADGEVLALRLIDFTIQDESDEEPPQTDLPYSETVSIPAGSSTLGCEETNECYIPADVVIASGGEVVWSNDDSASHTVTSGDPNSGSDGNFDSGLFLSGTTFSHKFEEAGEFPYFCQVHPHMVGTIFVGQSIPSPTPTPTPTSNIELAINLKKSEYDLGEMVPLFVVVSNVSTPQNVAITVTDPFGTVMVSRTLTTYSRSNAVTDFKIAESFKTGTYRIDATSSINGVTYSANSEFRVASQFNQIQIVSAQGTDQQGNPIEFSRGSMGFVKVQVNAQKPIATLITVNVFDADLTPLGVGSLKTTLNTGQSELILSFMIPEDAIVGDADIYVNALSDWVSAGGIPQTGEFAGQVRIN